MPISRLVAVSFRPASSVLSRTLASTGRVDLVDTARLTTDRPRARFSCMTDSFTSASLHFRRIRHLRHSSHCPRSEVQGGIPRRRWPGGPTVVGVYLLPIFSLRH